MRITYHIDESASPLRIVEARIPDDRFPRFGVARLVQTMNGKGCYDTATVRISAMLEMAPDDALDYAAVLATLAQIGAAWNADTGRPVSETDPDEWRRAARLATLPPPAYQTDLFGLLSDKDGRK